MTVFKVKFGGVEYTRTGSCKQCDGCKEYCLLCPHGELRDGKAFCTIYDTRHLVCEECSKLRKKEMTHEGCIKFPEHPRIKVILDGTCNYKFHKSGE